MFNPSGVLEVGDPSLNVDYARQQEGRISEAQKKQADDMEDFAKQAVNMYSKNAARQARRREESKDPELQAIIRENEITANWRAGWYTHAPTSPHRGSDQQMHDF